MGSHLPRFAVIIPLALVACGGENQAPVVDPLSDQVAFVNSEFSLSVVASDPDGDSLTFTFASELAGLDKRSSLTQTTPGRALFKWTPLAADAGPQAFDFAVSDGEATTTQTISINVQSSTEGSTAPVFVKPLGTGTTVDLTKAECAEVPLVIEDTDSAEVTLAQEEPVVPGTEVLQTGEFEGTWTFCPTKEQVASDDRYTVTLSADDGDNAKTLKNYLIVLRSGDGQGCPGEAPIIAHKAEDVSSVVGLTITANISDDNGMKYEPLFYYSSDAPADPPDLAAMTQVSMLLLDGDMKSGTWGADVPNPVAGAGAGASDQLHYVIVAQDNDDDMGACDHVTQMPATGAYEITVTNPGGSGGLGLCETCTADAQCGSDGDNCVLFDGATHCFSGCDQDSDCPTDYYCSFGQFESVDGAEARQCIPDDYECSGQVINPGTCSDDAYEDNDTLVEASSQELLMPGNYANLVSCPLQTYGDDEDWYRIDVSTDATVSVTLSGGSATDLDLAIKDASGTVIDKSDSLSSSEEIEACLTPGIYYLHVYGWGTGENSYTLNYSQTPSTCGGGSCEDDDNEDDDELGEARDAQFTNGKHVATTQAICSMDQDWYAVDMFSGETLYATLEFLQSSPDEDLDIWLFDNNGDPLTDCSESNPFGCDSTNGQSGTSDEALEWPIDTSGTYYVVVHGWDGSANLYDICISYTDGSCP